MLSLMSKAWDVFAESSRPVVDVKNARQTKDTKEDKMEIIHIQV